MSSVLAADWFVTISERVPPRVRRRVLPPVVQVLLDVLAAEELMAASRVPGRPG
ncbi:MAG: hypothetical protein AAGM22_27620 [Acidobacteriota bacterium]